MASNGNLSKEVTEVNIYVEFTQDAINPTGVEQLKILFFYYLKYLNDSHEVPSFHESL